MTNADGTSRTRIDKGLLLNFSELSLLAYRGVTEPTYRTVARNKEG